jgi:hypothetical protein
MNIFLLAYFFTEHTSTHSKRPWWFGCSGDAKLLMQ